MVKNTHGGSKHKSQARKLVNAPQSNKLRLPECDAECFAIVTKMLGNGMCHVNILHQNNILENIVCHIRGKFRGRNKKSNLISTSSIVLVGLRDWEKNISACDLLDIYNSHHIEKLDIKPLLSSFNKPHINNNDDDILFSNDNHDIIIDNNLHNNIPHDNNHDDIDFDLI
jgi:translation initiation factor IF-1